MVRGFLNVGEGEWRVPASYTEAVDPTRSWSGGDRDGDPFMTFSRGNIGTTITTSQADRGGRYLQTGWSANVIGLVQIAPARKWSFNLSGSVSALEGSPLPLGDERILLDRFFHLAGVSHELDDFRLDDLYLLDLRLEKEIPLKQALSLNVFVDGFNLFNDKSVQSRGANLFSTAPLWAFDTVSPRVFRLGVRLRWN